MQWHSPRRIAKKSARARIHRRRQHESRRETQRQRRPRDRHASILERLPHHFQHVALKFRQLIEKQHAVVPQRHFARPRHRSAANQSRIANRMVRRPERPRAHQPARIVQQPRDAVNPRRLNRLFQRHRRQNRGDALRQHRLSRARRPDQQNVVASRARHFHRALRRHLSAHVAHIHRILARLRQHLPRIHRHRPERFRRR